MGRVSTRVRTLLQVNTQVLKPGAGLEVTRRSRSLFEGGPATYLTICTSLTSSQDTDHETKPTSVRPPPVQASPHKSLHAAGYHQIRPAMADSSDPTWSTSGNQIPTLSISTTDGVNEARPQIAQRVRRRNRIISSCLECRRRKLKCDRGQPCTNCVKASRQCLFISPSFDAAAQAKLAEVKEKMGILERSLEADLAQSNRARTEPLSAYNDFGSTPRGESYSGDEEEEDIKDLESSAYVREDAAYYEDEEGDDSIVDLGVVLGKLRITERIGGLVRPKFGDEVSSQTHCLNRADAALSSNKR